MAFVLFCRAIYAIIIGVNGCCEGDLRLIGVTICLYFFMYHCEFQICLCLIDICNRSWDLYEALSCKFMGVIRVFSNWILNLRKC